MNRDRFFDALGGIDENMLKETELLRQSADGTSLKLNTSEDTSSKTVAFTGRRPAKRRLIFVLAACLVLALGSVAVASGIFRSSGSVTTGTDEDGNPTYCFEPTEDMRLPLSAFTGEVQNVPTYLYEYWQRSRGVEFSYPDRRIGTKGFVEDYDAQPFQHMQNFDTIEEAAAYIGYDKIVIPEFAKTHTPDWLYVSAMGTDPDWSPDSDIEPNFELSSMSIRGKYYFGDMFIVLEDLLITEKCPESRAIQLVIAPDTQLSSQIEVANDRAFQVVGVDHPVFDAGYVEKEYIWAEDKVEYHLTIRYRADEQDKANTVIYDWMNSFGK